MPLGGFEGPLRARHLHQAEQGSGPFAEQPAAVHQGHAKGRTTMTAPISIKRTFRRRDELVAMWSS